MVKILAKELVNANNYDAFIREKIEVSTQALIGANGLDESCEINPGDWLGIPSSKN